jgi:hypothetical protein
LKSVLDSLIPIGESMGAFFTNFQVRGASTKAICAVLPKLTDARAFVSPPGNGWVTIYAEATENQREKTICAIAAGLSKTFKTDVFGFLVHDSDIALYWLYRCGELVDQFNSAPDYFDQADEATRDRTRGDTDVLLPLCREGTSRARLDEVLHPAAGSPTFAEEIIRDLAKLLGIDEDRAGIGFKYFDAEGADIFPDAGEFEPIGPGAARKTARVRAASGPEPMPQPGARTNPQPDHYAIAVHMLTQMWSERYQETLAQLTKMMGAAQGDILKQLRDGFDKSARGFLKKCPSAGVPAFEELIAARDQGPEALAVFIAGRTPEKLAEVGVVAAESGLVTFLAALLKHGLDPKAPNVMGRTPLDAAAKHGVDSKVYQIVKRAVDGE